MQTFEQLNRSPMREGQVPLRQKRKVKPYIPATRYNHDLASEEEKNIEEGNHKKPKMTASIPDIPSMDDLPVDLD